MARSGEAVDISAADHDFSKVTTGIYVGITGDVKVTLADGTSTVTFTNVPVGILEVSAQKVFKVGTDADEMVGLW